MRYFIVVVSVVILFAALYFWQCDNPVAVAQQPRQWRSGDTLWYEIDSVPYFPANPAFADSMFRWQDGLKYIHDRDFYSSPQHEQYAPVKLDYKIPYWSVYRRSITVWGITFSTGQPNPYEPYPEAAQSADVLSMPLNKSK